MEDRLKIKESIRIMEMTVQAYREYIKDKDDMKFQYSIMEIDALKLSYDLLREERFANV